MHQKNVFTLGRPCHFLNNRITKREVNLDGNRLLFIAKPKIGGIEPFESSLELFYEKLQLYINKCNPTDVFIIGKILNSTKSQEIENQIPLFLNKIEQIPIKIHVLSGNDERVVIAMTETTIDIIKEYIGYFEISTDTNSQTTFLVCDAIGNDVNVDVDAGCAFLMAIKQNFSIPLADFLISGYVSPAFIETDYNVISPGSFSFENNKIEYFLLDTSNGLDMEIYTEIDTEEYKETHPTSTISYKRNPNLAQNDCTCYI